MTDFLDADLRFHRDAFSLDVTLSVREGARVGLIGPNGAGKSTLLELLAGHLPLSDGHIRLGGRVLDEPGTHVAVHRRGVVASSQDPHLFVHANVRGNVEYGPRAHGVPRAQAAARAADLMARLGLDGLADRPSHALSAGWAQRVALARALAVEPALLLLDEPFAALDVTAAAELRAALAGLLASRGTTMLLVSHDLLDILTLTDHVLVLEDGRLADAGPTDRVLRAPRSSFAAELTGITVLEGHAEADGFRCEDGLLLPGPHVPGPGRVRCFVPPEAVSLALEPPGAPVRVAEVVAAAAGVAVRLVPDGVAVPDSKAGPRWYRPVSSAWLRAGDAAWVKVDWAKARLDATTTSGFSGPVRV